MKILGIDQSLTNIGINFLKIEINYYLELNNYLIKLNELINLLNSKSQSINNIKKKMLNKNFNFFNELDDKKIKYTIKEKEKIKILYTNLLEEQKNFINKFNNEFKHFNLFNKNISIYNFIINIKNNTYLLNSKEKDILRLNEYENNYINIINNNKIDNKINFICGIEGYSYNSKTSTRSLFELGELAGMLKLNNLKFGIKTIIVPPAILKKFMTNKGNSQKEEIKIIMKKRTEIVFKEKKDDDLYDALGISLFVYFLPFLNINDQIKIKIINN